jgi:hypothetical protein
MIDSEDSRSDAIQSMTIMKATRLASFTHQKLMDEPGIILGFCL